MDLVSPSACVPNEIYAEILHHLHYLRDRRLLLSLALVNQVFRHESQRVLFSRIDREDAHETTIYEDATRRHTLFLQAVINHPKRLGPYVLTYAQDGLACDPKRNWEDRSSDRQLWTLTKNALPEMVNLKYLFFRPAFLTPYPSENLLLGCNFQLEILIWICGERMPEYLAKFLTTQRRLLHFEFGLIPGVGSLGWLPNDACPNLMSTSCGGNTLATLMHWKKIVALDVDIAAGNSYMPGEENTIVLRRLECMRVSGFILHFGFPGMVLLNIVLLDIDYLDQEDMKCLGSFPNLRVLVLREYISYDTGIIMNGTDVPREVVLRSFQRCPLLERVISHSMKDLSSHTTFTIMRSEGDTQLEVKEEVTDYEHDPSRLWWSRYNV